VSVSSGSGRIPYVRARAAIDAGNLHFLVRNASELPRFRLSDALDICVLYVDRDIDRYEAAAIRWLTRFANEAKGVSLADIQAAAAALDALPEQPLTALAQLKGLCRERKAR
jgi:hypothetical protein